MLHAKSWFSTVFLLFTASVRSRPPGPPAVPQVFLSVFCFWPTSGNLPCVKICFPQYLFITRRYMQRKYSFFLKRAFFRPFTANVRSRPPGRPAVPGVFVFKIILSLLCLIFGPYFGLKLGNLCFSYILISSFCAEISCFENITRGSFFTFFMSVCYMSIP